ncbi:hypothetical protein WJX75_002187 [Coccomyxa subellipsoidea]|uniref:Aminoglycoside phosphotransferase domain-containing protein n=1 Tax=Coccomyxa subellipsoidea TaxID=248742 RepID=A0ABR2YT40_9CHLO
MDRMDKLRKLYPDAMQRAYYTVKLLPEPEGRLEYLKDPDDKFVKNALELMFGPAPVSETILPDAAFFGVLKDGAAAAMVALVSQILEDEREDMQPQMAQLLEDWLGPYEVFVQSKHGQPVVDIAGTLRGIKVLMNELKTDNGGNARIELLRYYGADVASVWESASGAALLDRFCLPRLYVEVNTGLMCVGGMAIIGRDLLKGMGSARRSASSGGNTQGKLRLQARDQLESAGQLPEPATELEWPAVCKAATDALGRGHRALVTLPGCNVQPSSTVHADARLINIMARRKEGGKWEVKYVDFAWSGIHERTRYPVLMSPDVKWPLGAQAQGLLRQKHDQELLTDELEKGLGREVLADVH